MANLDDDDNLEIVVGSGSGRIYVFDGSTYETQWVSPQLDKIPIGIAIGDLDSDGNNDIAVSTAIPGEAQGENGEGGEGYLYIFERSGDGFTETFKSDNIDAALGITISELDGTTHPEIGIATGYLEIINAEAGTTDLHGAVKVWDILVLAFLKNGLLEILDKLLEELTVEILTMMEIMKLL